MKRTFIFLTFLCSASELTGMTPLQKINELIRFTQTFSPSHRHNSLVHASARAFLKREYPPPKTLHFFSPDDATLIFPELADYCTRNNIAVPTLLFVDTTNSITESFTLDRTNASFLILSRGTLQLCTYKELVSIIAHEIGHISNLHDIKKALLRGSSFIASLGTGLLTILYTHHASPIHTATYAVINTLATFLFCTWILHRIHTNYEYDADRYALELTKNKPALVQTLQKLKQYEPHLAHELRKRILHLEKD